ncbi:13219_t:CDS:1, partial [Funneliformis caledonium]
RHKTDWGFNQDDNWNSQNREKLLETLQEFTNRNANGVNVYLGTYKNQNAYLVIDHTSYRCLIVYRGGEKDYFLWSGWVLGENQYKSITKPPYKLNATILLVYEEILEQIANSEGERDDLILQYLGIFHDDKNFYEEKVYDKFAEFFGLAESYIPLSFDGRDEITPEDNYELDFEKIRKKAGTILGELEKVTL